MDIASLKNKMVAVLGYGLEGQAVSRYLSKHGIAHTVFDQKPQEPPADAGANFISGAEAFDELAGFQIAFRSPGIPAAKLKKWTGRGLTLTSQTGFFFENCPAKIIGVTGTKGKGTAATLIHRMLSGSRLTGNIGLDQPLDILDTLSSGDLVVYELSSFQLQDLKLSPHIGVVLMVTSDHLDYHASLDEYRDAKTAITKYQRPGDLAVVNSDFEASKAIGILGQGRKLFFSRLQRLQEGCWIDSDSIKFSFDGQSGAICRVSEVGLRGRHNLENICAATLASLSAGASPETVAKVVRSFKGLEHRLELVAHKDGVSYYNDSFSTTPETTIAAIDSFSEPLVIIVGGSEKNSDFGSLGQKLSVSANIQKIIVIGESGPRIKAAFEKAGGDAGLLDIGAKNMGEILRHAKKYAQNGSVVLLSPGCASFDMFDSYKERGEQFKAEVNKL